MKYRVNFSIEGEIILSAKSETDARRIGESMVREIDPAKFDMDLNVKEIDELEEKMNFEKEKEKLEGELEGDDFRCSYCGSEGAKFCKKRTSPLSPAFVCEKDCLECPFRDDCEEPVWEG